MTLPLVLESAAVPQLRLAYDPAHSVTLGTDAAGVLNLTPAAAAGVAIVGAGLTVGNGLVLAGAFDWTRHEAEIRRDRDNSSLQLYGGSSYATGGQISLYGTTNDYLPGGVELNAAIGSAGEIWGYVADQTKKFGLRADGFVVQPGPLRLAYSASVAGTLGIVAGGDMVLTVPTRATNKFVVQALLEVDSFNCNAVSHYYEQLQVFKNGQAITLFADGSHYAWLGPDAAGVLHVNFSAGGYLDVVGPLAFAGSLTVNTPATRTTVGAAGPAAAMPAPLGYLDVTVGGVACGIPYVTRGA